MTGVLVEPNMDKATELIKEGLRKHEVVLIVGNCCVEYLGRASSDLGPGERIVLIKADGALLVHRSTGYEPVNWMPGPDTTYYVRKLSGEEVKKINGFNGSVNWQPPGCELSTRVADGVLEIRAVRRQPKEEVHICFDRVYLAAALSLADTGEFSLYASEEDMQRAILARPQLIEEGFKPISYEKRVKPGFVDVYGTDGKGRFVVVEIKRKTAGREAALQLAKYVEAIRGTVNREVRGVLAAPNIAKGVQRLLASLGFDYKALDPRKCAEILQRTKTKKLAEYFSKSE